MAVTADFSYTTEARLPSAPLPPTRISVGSTARRSASWRWLALVTIVLAACSATTVTSDPGEADGGAPPQDASVERDSSTRPPPADAAVAGSCDRYCALVEASCPGTFAQYESTEQCLRVCAALPAGNLGDRSGNSVGCRQSYAGNVSRTDPAKYCAVAGPFGGSVCGERCDSYCALALSACPGSPWASLPTCISACTNLRYEDGGADAGEGIFGPMTGDTLNCRTRHLLEAFANTSECASLASGGVCTAPTAAPNDR